MAVDALVAKLTLREIRSEKSQQTRVFLAVKLHKLICIRQRAMKVARISPEDFLEDCSVLMG